MEEAKIRHLLDKYYEGETSLEEEKLLRSYFNSDEVPESLKPEAAPFIFYGDKRLESVSGELEWALSPLKDENTGIGRSAGWVRRLMQAAAILLVAATGFGGGLWFAGPQNTGTDKYTSNLTSLISASLPASRRIQTVHALGASKGSDRIIAALAEAMNGDPNVNVRLAAAEALFRFRDEQPVRQALAESLNNQTDPNMQITLIDMLVRIRSKQGARVMKQLLLADGLQPVVRTRLEAGIADLI